MAKNNKTRFFYVLYSDKTRVFDQSERAYYPVCIIKKIWYPSNLALRDILFAFFRLYGFLVSYLIVFSLFFCKINSFGENSKTALCV